MLKGELLQQIDVFINDKKISLQKILKLFFDIKYVRIDNVEIIVSFQKVLAELMYDVSSCYNELCKNLPESDKKEYYKEELKMIINQCKSIGDGYAWIFYRNNIEELREHLKHEDNGLFPVRNGGIGEIEFISKNKVFEGCLVLYHSITHILRIGDFSLITMDGKLAGLGEIKTRQIGQELLIDAYITQRMLPVNSEVERIELDDAKIWKQLRK